MEIIRDLNENDNLIEPLTHDECISLWNYCYRNKKLLDGTVRYKVVGLCMLGSCEISIISDSDSSDIDSISPYVFSRNKKAKDHL